MPDVQIFLDLDAKGNLFGRVPYQPNVTPQLAQAAAKKLQQILELDQEIPIKLMSEPEQHVHAEKDRIIHQGHTHAR